jgi:hypothetical protein
MQQTLLYPSMLDEASGNLACPKVRCPLVAQILNPEEAKKVLVEMVAKARHG